MSVSKTTKPPRQLAEISSPWSPRDESTGLFPPLNLPVMHLSIDGRAYPINCPVKLVKSKDLFQPRDDDVIVATYPRSGTKLVLSICKEIHLLQNSNLPKDHPFFADTPINDMTPWIHNEFSATNPDKMPSPRVFKTHNYYQHLNIDREKVKVIHLYRNPKDVVCSLYYHMLLREPFIEFKNTFSDCVHWFLNGGLANGCYWLFNKEFFINEDKLRILHVSYEEMILNKPSAIKRINSFLGYKDLDEQQIAHVDKVTSLDPENLQPDQHGKPGKALKMLTVEQRNEFDVRCQKEFDGIAGIPTSYNDDKLYINQC